MYYQIREGFPKIDFKYLDPGILTLGVILLEELEACYNQFGFSDSTLMECRYNTQHIQGNFDSYHDYVFGIIFGLNKQHILKVQDKIAVYIKKNLLLIVIIEDTNNSFINKTKELMKRIKIENITLERLTFGFLERLISDEYLLLEQIETEISNHEDRINDRDLDKNFNSQITEIRKNLLLLDNYYQQLMDVGEELQENGADIFTEDNLNFFRVFTDRVFRLSNNTRMLQDYCVHVREAYHARLEYDLNKIMKLFTVVTTIFLPLTLIVGWYGMNFTAMPELTWKFGYLFVIVLSIIVAIICILFFRKKHFL
ncbi:hypothetical protein I5677_09775 [Mobilitalea sibirica]|uniref:Magnesium transporter n=1 Tax=Mobilitalea sibirica TaxID=1462919 RepID=A0A8J7HDU3_9FIRM|nr:CorA family divalent cation transporter [Mobilitalea sibirica]MBH1941179.1 hypothetical protein [Mobilitalea sibirica]